MKVGIDARVGAVKDAANEEQMGAPPNSDVSAMNLRLRLLGGPLGVDRPSVRDLPADSLGALPRCCSESTARKAALAAQELERLPRRDHVEDRGDRKPQEEEAGRGTITPRAHVAHLSGGAELIAADAQDAAVTAPHAQYH